MKVVDAWSISTEIGTRILPLLDYIQKGIEHSLNWFVVEQKHFVINPVESAGRNAKEIRNIVENLNLME